jgi:hypothetical protein
MRLLRIRESEESDIGDYITYSNCKAKDIQFDHEIFCIKKEILPRAVLQARPQQRDDQPDTHTRNAIKSGQPKS